jgi:hypothetical protein
MPVVDALFGRIVAQRRDQMPDIVEQRRQDHGRRFAVRFRRGCGLKSMLQLGDRFEAVIVVGTGAVEFFEFADEFGL